jgi:hypothetical protein
MTIPLPEPPPTDPIPAPEPLPLPDEPPIRIDAPPAHPIPGIPVDNPG